MFDSVELEDSGCCYR